MPEVPKIVYSRLRAGNAGSEHPDANLLTAFAEQALSPAERETVSQHLAACGDCREVVALALPASESVAEATPASSEVKLAHVRPVRADWNWFGWLGLRGAAVVAGVVIVASVLTLRPGKPQPPTSGTIAELKKQEPAQAQAPAPAPAFETDSVRPVAPSAETREVASLTDKNEEAQTFKPDARQYKLQEKALNGLKASPPERRSELARLQPNTEFRDSKRADIDSADRARTALSAGAATRGNVTGSVATPAVASVAPPSTGAPQPQKDAVQVGSASETVEVAAASPPISTTEQSAGVAADQLSAAPIAKAKAPVQSQYDKTAAMARTKKQSLGASSNPAMAYQNSTIAWRIADGTLQHSLDAGFTWQAVLPADHSLLCQKDRGSDVWAAGKAGTVFHSSDAGATWTELHPTANDQRLTADVIAITLEKPGETILTTNTGGLWTTMDNGKTWSVTGTIKK
jgi:photosynthesis system II assembly factor YCF48-like protein/putative zinc finger protein